MKMGILLHKKHSDKRYIKGGENMPGKDIVNLIIHLRASSMSDAKILDLIEYIETHDPKEQLETTQ